MTADRDVLLALYRTKRPCVMPFSSICRSGVSCRSVCVFAVAHALESSASGSCRREHVKFMYLKASRPRSWPKLRSTAACIFSCDKRLVCSSIRKPAFVAPRPMTLKASLSMPTVGTSRHTQRVSTRFDHREQDRCLACSGFWLLSTPIDRMSSSACGLPERPTPQPPAGRIHNVSTLADLRFSQFDPPLLFYGVALMQQESKPVSVHDHGRVWGSRAQNTFGHSTGEFADQGDIHAANKRRPC